MFVTRCWRVGSIRVDRFRKKFGTQVARKISSDPQNVIESFQELLIKYRMSGHLSSNLDPLKLSKISTDKLSNKFPETLMLKDEDGNIRLGKHYINQIEDLESHLKSIYCGNIGYEISHVEVGTEREWLYQKIEETSGMQASASLKKQMAKLMLESEVFDHFMSKKFGQVKRYGLEGGEGMLVAIDTIIKMAQSGSLSGCGEIRRNIQQFIDHFVFGMPHRGRLNLILGLLEYPAEALFYKLSGRSELPSQIKGTADVLSHLSHSVDMMVGTKTLKVTMLPNPSHLEAINPVEQGVVFALQSLHGVNALGIQIHGDAAFNGQGIVQETLQMSNLKGFSVGGMIHIILNNQVGYTATAEMGRSSRYSSSPAKMIGVPIFHVNGDSPEDIARVTKIAVEYRQKFGKDVIIDLICYRRHGHNELDEPSFTQPSMYRAVKESATLPTKFSQSLVDQNLMASEEVEDIRRSATNRLEQALQDSKKYEPRNLGIQQGISFGDNREKSSTTGVFKQVLVDSATQSVTIPESFNIHPRLQKYHQEGRLASLKEGKIDWATAEAMAFGSLLTEGFNVRLVGQDVQRGTFSQRHLVFHDQKTGEQTIPFMNWPNNNNGKLQVFNSHLSEFAVMGFEYGLGICDPKNTLSIWEAQFGDFFNGAQIIIDAFISSGETKWGLQSGLTLLLPHGYDGAGPEHSSCRLERFLSMSNAPYNAKEQFEPNWHVVNPTTPANYFHLLRRQLHRPNRKPLIVASPKVLLRLPNAISRIEDMETGTSFVPLLDDPHATRIEQIRRLVFCSGKFYYELSQEAHSRNVTDTAFIRIEELCPLPSELIKSILSKYKTAKKYIWCQEEHRNMGAYDYIAPRLASLIPSRNQLQFIGRKEASAPAAGYSQLHKSELSLIFKELFDE